MYIVKQFFKLITNYMLICKYIVRSTIIYDLKIQKILVVEEKIGDKTVI